MKNNAKFIFRIEVKVDTPILIGQDDISGRRQLIPITSGIVNGENFNGYVLPGGVDSQIIRPDGRCELSARYAIELNDGARIYIENNGIRTVPSEYVEAVLSGSFIDPSLYYFRTTPHFEVFNPKYSWLLNNLFYCTGERLPDKVNIDFFQIL